MTAPSKVSGSPRAGISPARARKPRKFPVSDGAPVEVVEDGPSLAGRLAALAALLTIRPTLAIGSYAPRLPWPWGLVDFVARVVRPAPGTVRATISLPNCTAQLVRAAGVLPADGKRSVILYMHGGAFLTCGANTHGRLVTALSHYADSPVLVVNYRMIPEALRGHGARRLLRRLQVAAAEGLRARPDRAGRRLRRRIPGAGAGRAAAARRCERSARGDGHACRRCSRSTTKPAPTTRTSAPTRCSRPRRSTRWSSSIEARRRAATSSTGSPKRSTSRSTTSSPACRAR